MLNNFPKPDPVPPAKVLDLQATQIGPSAVQLTWTTPADADVLTGRFHIIWDNKPISEAPTLNSSVSNWWYAKAVGPSLAPVPGTSQSLVISPSNVNNLSVALFTFDVNNNMSPMSNVATANFNPDTTPPTVSVTAPAGGSQLAGSRCAFSDRFR